MNIPYGGIYEKRKQDDGYRNMWILQKTTDRTEEVVLSETFERGKMK